MRFAFSILFSLFIQQGLAQVKNQSTDSLPAAVYHWSDLKLQQEGDDLKRSLFKGSTTTLNMLEVSAYMLPPAKKAVYFKHDDLEELMIVKDGNFSISINGKSQTMGPGSIAFVLPGDEHAIVNAGSTDANYYILKYKGKTPDHERGKKAGGSFMLDWTQLKTIATGKGYRRDFFNRATTQLAQFEMHTTALDKDSSSHAPHTHVQEEIILVLRGDVTMYIDGRLYPASAGDLVFLPSRIPHALMNTGKQQCEYFAFQWRN